MYPLGHMVSLMSSTGMTRGGGEDGDVDDGVDDDERNAKEPGRREVRQEGEGTLLTPRRRESAITPAEDRGRDAIFISPKSVRPAKKLPQDFRFAPEISRTRGLGLGLKFWRELVARHVLVDVGIWLTTVKTASSRKIERF